MDAGFFEKIFSRTDQAIDDRHQAGIEQRRQGAPRAAQFRGKLVAAGDGLVAQFADPIPHPDFMSRIPDGKISGYGE
ncbi:hypothetical protein D3C73_985510 [compost metagenome]